MILSGHDFYSFCKIIAQETKKVLSKSIKDSVELNHRIYPIT